MFSDALIIFFTFASCFNGWNRGLSRSLRGLVAMIVAVLAAPFLYPHLASWLYCRIDADPTQATVIGYLISLFGFIAIATAILVQLFNAYWEDNPWLLDRFGGFVYGGIKTFVTIVLAITVSLAPIHTSEPLPGRINLCGLATGSVFILPKFLPLAKKLFNSDLGRHYVLARKDLR